MVHVYENHLGGVYFSEEYDEDLLETCEQCLDNDQYLGIVENEQQLKFMLMEELYAEDYIKEMCNEYTSLTKGK